MKIINTCDKIKALFSGGFDMTVWRKYAGEISKELPSKCENDAKDYDFKKDVLPVLESALNADKIDFVSKNFHIVVDTLNANLSKLFDTEPDINIILYLGLCNGAGWATTLDGKNTVLLGVEKIIELDWNDETNMRALILHEIGHLWHKLNGNLYLPEFTKRRKAIAQLYCEGVAMVCEHILCGDDDFYHQDKNGWLDWCRENETEIKKEYLRRLDAKESVQDFFGDWCSYNGYSDVGYYLGCRFVENLMKSHPLKEIANFSYRKINKEFKDYARQRLVMKLTNYGMPTLIETSTLEDCAKLCAESGLDFIELNMNMPQYQLDKIDVDYFKSIADKYGIYYTIHLDENLNVSDFNPYVAQAYSKTVEDTIEIAKLLDAKVVNMHMARGVYFTLPDRKVYLFSEYKEQYLKSIVAFRNMCENTIGDANIKIGIENCDGYEDFQEEAIEILLKSNVFALTFDVGHNHGIGGTDEGFIMKHKDRLHHIHLHDAEGKKNHLALGTGEMNIEKYISLANEHNCRVVLETKTIDGLKQSVEWLKGFNNA